MGCALSVRGQNSGKAVLILSFVIGSSVLLGVGCNQASVPENKIGNPRENFGPINKENSNSLEDEGGGSGKPAVLGLPAPTGNGADQLGTIVSDTPPPINSSQPMSQSTPTTGTGSTDKAVSTPSEPKQDSPVVSTPPAPQLPPLPSVPEPTHRLTVDCTGGLNIAFAFGGRVQPFKMSGGSVNGQPTELQTTYCPKIKTVLDQKSFPTGKTLSKPQGGAGLSGSCSAGLLNLKYVSGGITNGSGTGVSVGSGVDIESAEVCLEVRNIINGLMLSMAGPA